MPPHLLTAPPTSVIMKLTVMLLSEAAVNFMIVRLSFGSGVALLQRLAFLCLWAGDQGVRVLCRAGNGRKLLDHRGGGAGRADRTVSR
ncbi:hypothetical protein AMK25_21780 [Micromonospora sp. TSRI0369]|nr:hypothetical protein AMK25_21780 [Micromonospora sp. TSRI0369]